MTLTGIQIRSHICEHFQTSFVLELLAMSIFALKLLMLVIVKALLSLYTIDISIIHEAQNASELFLFLNPPFLPFFLYNMPIFLITNIDNSGRWPCPWQVGAQYG